jgi:hypothetical protein
MHDRRILMLGAAAAASTLAAGCGGRGPDAYEIAVARQRERLPAQPELRDFVRFATLAANSHNTQPWRFVARSGGVSILPDVARRTPAVDPDDHHLFVSLGCAAENLMLAAAAHGRPAASAFVDDGEGGIDIDLGRGGASPSALADAIPHRQSTRSDYDGSPVSADDLRLLEQAARMDGVSLRLLTGAPQREEALGHVMRANGAQMDDPAFVGELLHWIRFSKADAMAQADGLFAACSGNPTLPGWLGRRMFRFVFTRTAENRKYASQIRSSAGIAVFVGDKADKRHWVQVGRSFQRFALQATALGIRHAHINQPVEVPAARAEFSRWLGVGEARPDLMVRFGRAPAMPMSLRRPVAAVLRQAA